MGVERFYDGILKPSAAVDKNGVPVNTQNTATGRVDRARTPGGTGGFYDGILPGATGAPSGGLVTRSVRTVQIDPYTGMPATPKAAASSLTQAQLQAIKNVPAGSYQWPRNTPLNTPGQPAGYSYADTGNRGRATGAMTGQIALAGYQPTLAGMFGRGQPAGGYQPSVQVPNIPTAVASAVPLPRYRPAEAPRSPEMEAAMSPDATLGDLLAYADASSGTSAPVNPALGAVNDMAGATPSTSLSSMFSAPASARPADAYAAANALGTLNAQQKRSTLSGVGTNGYTYVDGKNVGYSAEEQAKRAAQGQAIGDANRRSATPTRNVSGDNNSFMPKSVQNSVRWQTGY